jgi:predicted amidophosphoribosyltransferase
MDKIFTRSDGSKLEILYPPYCEICGNPIPNSFASTHPYCGACKDAPDKRDPLVKNRAFGKYYFDDEKPDDILSNEIRKLKTDKTVLPLVLECLFHAIDTQYPLLASVNVVVPVMRGTTDKGFNQSALLAQGISCKYNMPFLDVLYKKAPYRSMHNIHDVKEKEKEISGKIGCNHSFKGETILLIDDTCITLTTKRECAKVLREHGAGQVWSLVVGRMVNEAHMATLRRYND